MLYYSDVNRPPLLSSGFLFLYELMRGDVFFKLLSNDAGHTLGCFLLRMLPQAEWAAKGMLMSTLRAMAQNPQAWV